MTDQEWATAFVGCKIQGTGVRFAETVEVLAKKLAQAREEAVADFRRRERPVATDGGFTVADRPAVQGNPPLPPPGDFTRQ